MQPVGELTDAVRIDCCLNGEAASTLARDAREGLTQPLKELPPKHLYDARGSELFERICELPEYYPTRTERAILEANAEAIVATAQPVELVELGSGYATKTRLLLDAMADAELLERYVGLDVSESVVRGSAAALAEEYPGLLIHGVIGDFERHLDRVPPGGSRLVALLGGTIGNLPPTGRLRLLRRIAALMRDDDHLLLGVDLVKDPAVIEAAYDDAAGVTAEFNRNVLRVLNRELEANFDLELFDHVAFFDRGQEWIEMRLRARRACSVQLGELDLEIEFSDGEELRTEISAKFTRQRLRSEFAAAGLELRAWYTDPEELFALALGQLNR